MSDRIVTVFGGSGFLGSAIARALAECGAKVRIAARHPRLPGPMESEGNYALVTADIRDEISIAHALDGASAAINAVGLYTEPSRNETFDIIHAQGAEHVARQAREAGLEHLVHISGIGASRDSPSPYIRARAHGEQAVVAEFQKAFILRPSVLFGPHDAFLGSLAMLSRFPLIPLFGRGETRLQPVLVDDVARAAVQLALGPAAPRQVFELGGGEIYRYREIVEKVLAHLGRRRPLLPVPFPAWMVLARMASVLPSPPLTENQIILMQEDKIVGHDVGRFADLGIVPYSLEEMLPSLLETT